MIASAKAFGVISQRQLKNQRTENRKQTGLRLRLLSTTKREIRIYRTALEARPIGRAESVPVEAFACLLWGVSSHAYLLVAAQARGPGVTFYE